MPDPITHFVFVDFENVPDFDLELIAGHPIRVIVLVGKNQTKHLTKLKEQLRKLKLKGAVIEVGAAGRNALDIALAFYLGQAVQHNPSAQFCILARDRGYESLIQHLHAKEVKIARYGETHLLPFLKKPKKSAPSAKPAAQAKAPPEDRLEKLITRLKNNLAPRPKNKARLLAHINTAYGQKLTATELIQKLDELIGRGVLVIEDKDKVRYL